MRTRDGLGPWGEALAAKALRRGGYRIVERNYRSRFGEIDLIAENGAYLAFVEGHIGVAVCSCRKQQRIRATAMLWLEAHETALQPRFDVIEIYAPDGTDTKKPEVRHLEDAFE